MKPEGERKLEGRGLTTYGIRRLYYISLIPAKTVVDGAVPASADSVLTLFQVCLSFSGSQAWSPCRRPLMVTCQQLRSAMELASTGQFSSMVDECLWDYASPLCVGSAVLKCIPTVLQESTTGLMTVAWHTRWSTSHLLPPSLISLTFPNPKCLFPGATSQMKLYAGKLLCPAVLGEAR